MIVLLIRGAVGRSQTSSIKALLAIALGTVIMRAAGCVINDYADRNFDPHVERTRLRPIAAGEVSPKEALWLFVGLCLSAFILVLQLNTLSILLSFPGAFLAASYPFTKRFTSLPQAYLGIAFGFGIPMAFAAEQSTIPQVAWVLLIANVFWAIAYDTEYAMVDRNDDIHLGIHSSALWFGKYDVVAVMVCYAIALSLLAIAGHISGMGWLYYSGLIAAFCIALYHFILIRGRDRDNCFKAFLHNNWFGAAVFTGIATDFIFNK